MPYSRIVGNTESPCYYALLDDVKISAYQYIDEARTDGYYTYEASKDEQEYIVSVTSMYELLALVTMGEIRGFSHADWKLSKEKIEHYFDLKDRATEYDYIGNVITE